MCKTHDVHVVWVPTGKVDPWKQFNHLIINITPHTTLGMQFSPLALGGFPFSKAMPTLKGFHLTRHETIKCGKEDVGFIAHRKWDNGSQMSNAGRLMRRVMTRSTIKDD